jgi:hypothetical protein
MKKCSRRLACRALVLLAHVLCTGPVTLAAPTVARVWNEELLHAISIDTARPTVHARNLFHLSAAMYDAWAAYDANALQYIHHEKVSPVDIEAERNEAISYAAYNVILHRFVTGPGGVGPGRAATVVDIRNRMTANESNRYANPVSQFDPVNPPLTFEDPGRVCLRPLNL